jgi:hypothetical protein
MRHLLTDEERLRGVERSLQSSRTPQSLKEGLRRYREQLRAKIENKPRRKRSHSKRRSSSSLLGSWLRL